MPGRVPALLIRRTKLHKIDTMLTLLGPRHMNLKPRRRVALCRRYSSLINVSRMEGFDTVLTAILPPKERASWTRVWTHRHKLLGGLQRIQVSS